MVAVAPLCVFQLWFGSDNVRTYQIVKSQEQHHSEHALIRIGNYFLDGDGVSREEQLVYRWITEEYFPAVVLREFDPYTEPDCTSGEEPFYISDDGVEQLVRLLDRDFDKNEILDLLK